jgi:hypothetical protein
MSGQKIIEGLKEAVQHARDGRELRGVIASAWLSAEADLYVTRKLTPTGYALVSKTHGITARGNRAEMQVERAYRCAMAVETALRAMRVPTPEPAP